MDEMNYIQHKEKLQSAFRATQLKLGLIDSIIDSLRSSLEQFSNECDECQDEICDLGYAIDTFAEYLEDLSDAITDCSDVLDDVLCRLPGEMKSFCRLINNLEKGFSEYVKTTKNTLVQEFWKKLKDDLVLFANAESMKDKYDFSIVCHHDYGEETIRYIEFHFEQKVLEITCGGHASGDSYTEWVYSLWNNGHTDNESFILSCFDEIYEMLCDPANKLTIENPEEFCFCDNRFQD